MTPPSACPPDPNRLQATPCPKSRMGEPSTRLCSGNPSAGMPTRRRTSAGKVSTGKKDFSPLGPGSTRAPSRIHGSFAGVVDHPTCLPRPATGNAARPGSPPRIREPGCRARPASWSGCCDGFRFAHRCGRRFDAQTKTSALPGSHLLPGHCLDGHRNSFIVRSSASALALSWAEIRPSSAAT